ncbi:MAG: TIGR04551 family protein [Deltaproteobacteria bacterium]|nr:TIGR04551 family protein [Deltaproteobacteria bacterium]
MQDLLRLLATSVAALALMAGPAFAQPPVGDDTDEVDDEDLDDEDLDDEDDFEDEDEPQLRPPQLEMPDVSTGDEEVEEEEEELDEEEEEEDVDPGSDMDLLSEAEPPPSSDPTLTRWTAPRSVVTLNGYFRTRGELWDNFFLGRGFDRNEIYDPGDGPFSRFVPADRIAASATGGGGCDTIDDTRTPCNNSDRQRFANMRLRIRPTIALSDDVKVHMMIDALDNLILGSTPDSVAYVPTGGPDGSTTGYTRPVRTPGVPIDTFASTQNPSQANRNSGRDSIYVRRAWAEVTNRGIGQLRFGRMGSHWGLGMFQNGGDGIDADFSSDVDRIMLVTKLAGFHFFGAYDFASQGITNQLVTDFRDVPFDLTAKDDIRQYVLGAARRTEDEEAEARLQRGSWVLEGGLYFMYRSQSFSTAGISNAFPSAGDYSLVERDARQFIPDLWGRFRMGGLRLEVEMAAIIGDIGNIDNDVARDVSYDIRQFGIAFEGEYRLLDDKLAIRLYTGYASGDADVNGLSARDGLLAQRTDDRTISTFQFHPNYRIDLILWRNIMQRVSGAWYLKPGLGYDIIKNPFGQIFGIRADAIYSRAAQEVQAYGADPNLGLELNFSLYYQSEDGPDLLDGFYASFQYGVLFPLAGLEFASGDPRADVIDVGNAQALRLILGVQY